MSNFDTSPLSGVRISEVDLSAWVAKAKPQDTLEYYRGFLAIDRTRFGEPMSREERRGLVQIGIRAMRLADAGLVHLVQRRLGPDRFSYLAIACPRPKNAPASLSAMLLKQAA